MKKNDLEKLENGEALRGLSGGKRFNVLFLYCLPAVLACALLMYAYYARISDIEKSINVVCLPAQAKSCRIVEDLTCHEIDAIINTIEAKEDADKTASDLDLVAENRVLQKICVYRERYASNMGYDSESELGGIMAASDKSRMSSSKSSAVKKRMRSDKADIGEVSARKYSDSINANTRRELLKIFSYNALAVVIMVMLPFFLMGDLLAKSNRISLNYRHRVQRANTNWWIKFLVSTIMVVGLLYIINPLGRGASTYFQFFIAVGLENEQTLPIYIKAGSMAPVLAGFFGWYLHMIGYVFTKLIHHDVISSRVYSLLFKKFIVTYGIALVLPESGLLDDVTTAAFFMFLVGLFPLSAMSILIEAVSKFGSSEGKSSGNLSQLPGISRWQILRLEEEGVDSMASLACVRPQTVTQNLQVMKNLTYFWVNIAQLYTVVGEEAYKKINAHCLTASEFVKKSKDPKFVESIHALDGVSEVDEIAALLIKTFKGKLIRYDESPENIGFAELDDGRKESNIIPKP